MSNGANKNRFVSFGLVTLAVALMMGASTPVLRCCKDLNPSPNCSNCLGVDEDGDTIFDYYIDPGDTPGLECRTTIKVPSSDCDEELLYCGSGGPYTTYQNTNALGLCNQAVGVELNVAWSAMQCDDSDDACR